MITERDLDLLLGRPIVVNRGLVVLLGDHMAAIMLGQGLYWHQKLKEDRSKQDRDGWFWKTQDEWFEETGMTRGQQERARRKLREFDFWQEELREIPAKLWFRIDIGKLAQALSECAIKHAHNEPTGARTPSKQSGSKRANIHTKITSEITPYRANELDSKPVNSAEEEYLKNK